MLAYDTLHGLSALRKPRHIERLSHAYSLSFFLKIYVYVCNVEQRSITVYV